MTSPARQLSSLVSLPKILSDSLVAALAPTTPGNSADKLAPRCVYPIRLTISAEALNQVGSEILWKDISSHPCKHSSSSFSTREHPICVWVGDGNLATAADACITIRLMSRRLQPASGKHSLSVKFASSRRKPTWRQWLTCQDMQVEEPLLVVPDATVPLLQDTAEPQELLQETILLQEVFLTAHMAKAYEFPTPEGGLVKVEVVIGIPQRGPYHLALRQANPGTLFTDHNEDDVFAVLPLPPRVRRSFALPPKHPSPPRPSLQGPLPDDKMKIRSVSFKNRDIDSKDGMPASDTAQEPHNSSDSRAARKSTSRKQLHFAPIQLGRISEQPHREPSNGAEDELLSPGRSRSLGAAADRALLREAVDAELAATKDRPHSAQVHRTVHARDVTVFADEHAALQLVSQGSIPSAARRVSRSKQEPLFDMERRRSHLRASTPTAKDMQTGAPSLDFQIMHLNGESQGRFASRCVQDDAGLCISIKDPSGNWKAWAHLTYPSGPSGSLQLQDIKVVLSSPLSASASASSPAAATDLLSSGSFLLSSQHASSSSSPTISASSPHSHHWVWSRTTRAPSPSSAAAAAASASPASPPITSKPSSLAPVRGTKQKKKSAHKSLALPADSSSAGDEAAAAPSHGSPDAQTNAASSSSPLESGLVEMACIAVRGVEPSLHSQLSLGATKQYGSRGGSRAGSRTGSRTGSRAGSRRNLIASQLSEAGSMSQTEALTDRCEWHSRRRATEDDLGWRGRATDDSSVSGASRREPCQVALWFNESCAQQAAALACLSYALYALTHAAAIGNAHMPSD